MEILKNYMNLIEKLTETKNSYVEGNRKIVNINHFTKNLMS